MQKLQCGSVPLAVQQLLCCLCLAGAHPQPTRLRDTCTPPPQDGLLYTEAEKLNAAYLLRFAAPDGPGAREALLHLSLPDSGEPAAVRAWAASLATAPTWQLEQLQAAGAASPGGLGQAAGTVQAPTSQEMAAAELMHRRSPQQVLADTAAPLDGQVEFCGLQLGLAPPLLPWQQQAGAVQPSAQLPQAQQQPAALEVEASLAVLGAASVEGSGGSLQPASTVAALPQVQPPEAPQLQPQQPPPQQQQQQQQQLSVLQSLLSQAASSPLVPATQQRLIDALRGSLAAALTEAMAEAVDGGAASSSGFARDALQPHQMRGLVEHNSSVAAEVRGLAAGGWVLNGCAALSLAHGFPPVTRAVSIHCPAPTLPARSCCWR